MYSFGFISRVIILLMGLLLIPSSSRISNADAFQPLPTSTSKAVFSFSSTRKLSSSSKLFVSGSCYDMEHYDDDSSSGKSVSTGNNRRRNDKRYPNTNTNDLQKHTSLRMNQLGDARFFQTMQHHNQRQGQRQRQRQRRLQSSLQAKPNGRSSSRSRGEEIATAALSSTRTSNNRNRNRRRRKSPTARIQLLRPVRIIDQRYESYHSSSDSNSSNNISSRTPTRLQISSGLTFLDELGDQLLVSTQKPLGVVLEERGGGDREGGAIGDGDGDGDGGAPAGPASKMISENKKNLNININSIITNNNNNMGCIVSQVVQGGNADRAGVQVGDYLVAVQNVDVEMASFEEVMDRIASAPKVVNLRFWRRHDE